jgi:hypothetical protein
MVFLTPLCRAPLSRQHPEGYLVGGAPRMDANRILSAFRHY